MAPYALRGSVVSEIQIANEKDLSIQYAKLREANICNGGFLYTKWAPVASYHGQVHGKNTLGSAKEKDLYEAICWAGECKALVVTQHDQIKFTQRLLDLSKDNDNKYLEVTYLGPWRAGSKDFIEAHPDAVLPEPSSLWMLRRKDVSQE